MSSPAFEAGKPPEAAIELGRVVERGLRESKAIDTEALCILSGTKAPALPLCSLSTASHGPGPQAWSVHVTIHVLDHCGNLIDCASIAVITALLHFLRPDVSVAGDQVSLTACCCSSLADAAPLWQVTVHSAKDREPVPLSIHHIPIAITFALFDEGYARLASPPVLSLIFACLAPAIWSSWTPV